MHIVNHQCILPLLVGQNGLLPNQDIFNALVAVSKRLNAHLMFDGQADSRTGGYSPKDKYFASLRTILHMVAQQATGLQGGLHGVFVRQAYSSQQYACCRESVIYMYCITNQLYKTGTCGGAY